jgi:hypothetical protein
MKKNEWDETEIEHLLRDMPSLKDNRSRDEIYQAVTRSKAVRKPKSWGYPALAGTAAVLILALIAPSLFNSLNHPEYENSASDMAVEESADTGSVRQEIEALPEREENLDAGSSSLKEPENKGDTIMMNRTASEKTNVYEEDLLQYDVFTFGLAAPDAFAVPVSVLVDKSAEGKWPEKFEEAAEDIPEEEWGFNEYHPLSGSLSVDNELNELVYTLTDEELERLSGGSEDLFYDSLIMTLQTSTFEKIRLKKPDGSAPSFSHLGEVSEINKSGPGNKGYYKYTLESGDAYLMPGEESYSSIKDALTAMKSPPGSFYEPVISNDIQFEIKTENNLITISFDEELTLDDTPEGMLLIEGILMTAKDFKFEEVLFNNIENTSWKGFDFSQPVKVPIGPNKKILNW